MNDYYILEGKTPIKCKNVIEWGKAFENQDRRVAEDEIGNVRISTVFLGLNHGWSGELLLFETLVFEGELDGEMERYATWEEAEEGHKRMMERVKNNLSKK